MASSWAHDYLAALKARDAHHGPLSEVIDAYTRLAERSGAPHGLDGPSASAATTTIPAAVIPARSRTERTEATQQLEAALTERDEARSRLTAARKEAQDARASADREARTVGQLQAELAQLRRRARDRAAEVRDKARLLDSVQNETVALNLQLNVAEQRVAEVRGENEELVRRWKEKANRDAEIMNEQSSF